MHPTFWAGGPFKAKPGAVYAEFIDFWMDHLLLPKHRRRRAAGKVNNDQLIEEMSQFSKSLMLWGSNDVVSAYAAFRRQLQRAGRDGVKLSPTEILSHFEAILFQMRGEMGHSYQGAQAGDLLCFFVTEWDLDGGRELVATEPGEIARQTAPDGR